MKSPDLNYYRRELARLWPARYSFDQICGHSLAILQAKDRAWNQAATFDPMAVAGESGTGRRLLAHAVHAASPVQGGPLFFLNSRDPDSPLYQDLIKRRGLFDADTTLSESARAFFYADSTLVVHESGELPDELMEWTVGLANQWRAARQAGLPAPRLLVTTDTKTVERVEWLRPHRLEGLQVISLPGLRYRLEDIPAIGHRFIKLLNANQGTNLIGFSDDALELLMQYQWPGNIRELRQIIEHAGLIAQEGLIQSKDLHILKNRLARSQQPPTLKEIVMNAERMAISDALESAGGNKKMAAEQLGITRTSLYNKLKELGLPY